MYNFSELNCINLNKQQYQKDGTIQCTVSWHVIVWLNCVYSYWFEIQVDWSAKTEDEAEKMGEEWKKNGKKQPQPKSSIDFSLLEFICIWMHLWTKPYKQKRRKNRLKIKYHCNLGYCKHAHSALHTDTEIFSAVIAN